MSHQHPPRGEPQEQSQGSPQPSEAAERVAPEHGSGIDRAAGGHEQSEQHESTGQHQQSAERQELFPTANFLPEDLRATSCAALDEVLADLVVVHSQLLTAHWNVRGSDFYQFHLLFEELAETLEPHVDEIAERITALGGVAHGSVVDAAQNTAIDPLPRDATDGDVLLQTIAENLSALDATLYQHLQAVDERGDLDTADLLNEVSRDVSKALWFVEGHFHDGFRR